MYIKIGVMSNGQPIMAPIEGICCERCFKKKKCLLAFQEGCPDFEPADEAAALEDLGLKKFLSPRQQREALA